MGDSFASDEYDDPDWDEEIEEEMEQDDLPRSYCSSTRCARARHLASCRWLRDTWIAHSSVSERRLSVVASAGQAVRHSMAARAWSRDCLLLLPLRSQISLTTILHCHRTRRLS